MKWLNDDRMRLMLVGFVAAIVLIGGRAKADFTFGEPTNLGPNVNSSSSDYGVSISADGLSLFLDSDRPDLADYDLYVATRETTEDEWGSAVNLGPTVNSPTTHNEGCPSISVDGLELFFSGMAWQPNATGYGESDLWVTKRASISDDWSAPENLGALVNTANNDCEPSISADGLSLYFASDRPGGYSTWDLWVTTRKTKDDPWEEPVNLGEPVNSYNAYAPNISADGLVLFLASGSSRPGGLGQRDLWMTRRATHSDPWGEPINLGPAINTSAHDLVPCVSRDGCTLYFCSWGRPALGVFDLYEAPIIPIVDLNGDGIVDSLDMCIVVDHWGEDYPLCDIGPMPWGDGIVDVQDLIVLAEHLFEDYRMVAHWKMDETEDMIAHDDVGDCDGTCYGEPLWQPADGKVTGALDFDGMDDYVGTDCVQKLVDGSFSAFAWIKGGAPGQVILSQVDSSVGRTYILGSRWLGTDPSNGRLVTTLMDQLFGPLESQVIITDGQWHHIGLVYALDGLQRRLYVDGVEVAGDTAFVDGVLSDGGFHFGAGRYLSATSFWLGLIDDVRIYNVALSAEEIAALAQ